MCSVIKRNIIKTIGLFIAVMFTGCSDNVADEEPKLVGGTIPLYVDYSGIELTLTTVEINNVIMPYSYSEYIGIIPSDECEFKIKLPADRDKPHESIILPYLVSPSLNEVKIPFPETLNEDKILQGEWCSFKYDFETLEGATDAGNVVYTIHIDKNLTDAEHVLRFNLEFHATFSAKFIIRQQPI